MNRKIAFDGVGKEDINALLDEYIFNPVQRDMFRDWLVYDTCFSELRDKYGYSMRHTKRLVYRAAEKILPKLS